MNKTPKVVYLGCVRFIFEFFTLEAHCKSLVDLGAWDCIQFPLYVIVAGAPNEDIVRNHLTWHC